MKFRNPTGTARHRTASSRSRPFPRTQLAASTHAQEAAAATSRGGRCRRSGSGSTSCRWLAGAPRRVGYQVWCQTWHHDFRRPSTGPWFPYICQGRSSCDRIQIPRLSSESFGRKKMKKGSNVSFVRPSPIVSWMERRSKRLRAVQAAELHDDMHGLFSV